MRTNILAPYAIGLIAAAWLSSPVHAQTVTDQNGNTIPLDSIRIPSAAEIASRGGSGGVFCSTSGIFNVYFPEVDFSLGVGFDDAALGLARRNVVCRVFTDLSLLIQPANDPYTGAPNILAFVNITVRGQGLGGLPQRQAHGTTLLHCRSMM